MFIITIVLIVFLVIDRLLNTEVPLKLLNRKLQAANKQMEMIQIKAWSRFKVSFIKQHLHINQLTPWIELTHLVCLRTDLRNVSKKLDKLDKANKLVVDKVKPDKVKLDKVNSKTKYYQHPCLVKLLLKLNPLLKIPPHRKPPPNKTPRPQMLSIVKRSLKFTHKKIKTLI